MKFMTLFGGREKKTTPASLELKGGQFVPAVGLTILCETLIGNTYNQIASNVDFNSAHLAALYSVKGVLAAYDITSQEQFTELRLKEIEGYIRMAYYRVGNTLLGV